MSATVKARRARRHKGFESISRNMLQDLRVLTVKARGILAICLSLPDDWDVNGVEGFIEQFCDRDGYTSINEGIKELEAVGLFARLKRQGQGGKWEWLWSYSDDPRDVAQAVAEWEAKGYRTAGKRSGNRAAVPPKRDADPETPGQTVLGKPEHGTVLGESTYGQAAYGEAVHGEPPNKEVHSSVPSGQTGEINERETSTSTAPPPREDVELLCRRLRDRMIENGCKPPTITDTWRKAARLLLDKDGRALDKALNLIDWATQDEFWMANVQSMGKFRAQYDTLRLRAIADHNAKRRAATPTVRPSTTDARFLKQLDDHQRWFNPDGSLRSDSPLPDRRQLPSASPHGVLA